MIISGCVTLVSELQVQTLRPTVHDLLLKKLVNLTKLSFVKLTYGIYPMIH